MLHIALFEPEIPPNTGNIIRLAANMGAHLHLIEPMGFSINDKQCRRAGLDYHEWADICHYSDFNAFLHAHPRRRIIAATTKATQTHSHIQYQAEDCLLFGPESRGLPQYIRDSLPQSQLIRIPMQPQSRSLNLANAVAIIAYEAWRQWDYAPMGNASVA